MLSAFVRLLFQRDAFAARRTRSRTTWRVANGGGLPAKVDKTVDLPAGFATAILDQTFAF